MRSKKHSLISDDIANRAMPIFLYCWSQMQYSVFPAEGITVNLHPTLGHI